MGLFGPKRPVIKAEDLCKKYVDIILSTHERSFSIDTLAKLKSDFGEFQEVDEERYIEEIIALHIEILNYAWGVASLRGVIPREHFDAMIINTFVGSDDRLIKYEPLLNIYDSAIGRATSLPRSDPIREVTLTLLERLGVQNASNGLVERFCSEFSVLFFSMLERLKLWKLV
jgi:hypothetical protein